MNTIGPRGKVLTSQRWINCRSQAERDDPQLGFTEPGVLQLLPAVASQTKLQRQLRDLGSVGNLLRCPYVFKDGEAQAMVAEGANLFMTHVGLTTAGKVGAKTTMMLDYEAKRVQAMIQPSVCARTFSSSATAALSQSLKTPPKCSPALAASSVLSIRATSARRPSARSCSISRSSKVSAPTPAVARPNDRPHFRTQDSTQESDEQAP